MGLPHVSTACRFWFDRIDPRADAATAAYLRRELLQMTDPVELERRGLTQGQRVAYAVEYTRRATAILADRRRRADARLKQALAHAGALLCGFAHCAGWVPRHVHRRWAALHQRRSQRRSDGPLRRHLPRGPRPEF